MANSNQNGQRLVRTIFIADDDTDDLLLFTEALAGVDPTVKLEHVKNGIALISLLSHLEPDLLFLDLDMPGKNGLECLIEIRKNPRYELLPIIVFSSTSRP
ncbi:MAG TPA: response regulator, partial [Flavisolibacter sp.]|nr:response regulator [Flavisolibacter sp.]